MSAFWRIARLSVVLAWAIGRLMASVAVIVLNYKTPELTIDCLRSLQIQVSDRAGRHVIVIDNASGDGSAEKIEAEIAKNSWDAWVRLIQSSVNGGFAAGNNLGIHSENADRYLLLNSDTIVRPGAIDKLMETMDQDSDIGLVVPRLIGTDGSRQVSCFRYKSPISEMLAAARTGPIDRVFSRYRVPLPNAEPSMNVDWASFACILIRKAVFEDIGHLDDGFFMYFEDIDYCRRARKAGWKIRICPEAQVVHLHGQSSSLQADKAARKLLSP